MEEVGGALGEDMGSTEGGYWEHCGGTGMMWGKRRELEKLRGALGGNWVRYKRHWEVTGSTGAPQA